MIDCVFCKISQHKIDVSDVYYEDDHVLVMLDADWAVKGHSLIIWKEHHLNASDLSHDEFMEFSSIFHKAEKALLKLTNKERALALKTGGLVSHFHFHIYPVDVETSWQAVKDIFEKKTKYDPTADEKEIFLQALRSNMS